MHLIMHIIVYIKKLKEWLYPRLKAISVPTTMDTQIYREKGYNAYYIPHMTTFDKIVDNSLRSHRVINIGRLTKDKQQIMLLDIWKAFNKKIFLKTSISYKL